MQQQCWWSASATRNTSHPLTTRCIGGQFLYDLFFCSSVSAHPRTTPMSLPPGESTPCRPGRKKSSVINCLITVLSQYFAGSGREGGSTQGGGAMGSSERALQPHSSG